MDIHIYDYLNNAVGVGSNPCYNISLLSLL